MSQENVVHYVKLTRTFGIWSTLKDRIEYNMSRINKWIDKYPFNNFNKCSMPSFIMSEVAKTFNVFPEFVYVSNEKVLYRMFCTFFKENVTVIDDDDDFWLLICSYLDEFDFQIWFAYYSKENTYKFAESLEELSFKEDDYELLRTYTPDKEDI